MKTDFVDLSIDGMINFKSLSDIINNNIEKLKSDFTSSVTPDSLKSPDSVTYSYSSVCDNIDFKYTINVKDLAPLYSFTGGDTINIKGDLEGSLSDSCGVFYFVSNGVIREVHLKDSLLITDSAKIDIAIKNDINGYQLTGLEANVVIKANKLIVSKFLLDTTIARVAYTENKNIFNIWTQRDSTMKFFTEGNLMDSLIVNFDSLALKYKDFVLTNNKELIVQYRSIDTSQYINFRQFAINSFNQKLTVAGEYSLTDSSDIKLSASNVDLATYQKMFLDDPDTNNMVLGKIRYLDLEYKGIPKNPEIEIGAVSEELSIGSTKIGRLDANLKYSKEDLISNINFYNRKNTGSFSLLGNVPVILDFSDDSPDSLERIQKLADRKVDLNAVAKNFQLRVFQQLLPYTENLAGILEGKISLLGTSQKPVLTGKMDVNNGKVFVTLTKMNYGFFVNLSTDNEKLLINNSRIFVPSEKSRFISSSGYIDFTGLTLNDLMLQMSGDVKAFDKDNGDTQLGISGDLWVGSGRQKLTLRGNSERFELKGNLILVKGNVVFNPFVQEAYNIYTDDFNYGVLVDSLNDGVTVKKKIIRTNTDSVVIVKGQKLNPFEKAMYIHYNKDLKKEAKKSGGKFFYDIIVSTSGNVFLKFIVNEKSQQEFFGEIRTEDLNIYNYVDYSMMGRGTIRLGDNCYYKFFRKFDATGSATFLGPITNPQLNITAEYKGYTSTGTTGNAEQNLEDVVIDLKVTGNASSPVLTISIDRNGAKETGSDATSDAISFLLFGKFSDQLSFGESSSFGATVGTNYLSSYVSSSLEDIFPWLINTNFNYVDSKDGNVAQNTDVRFTAAVGDAIIRFGGQIFRGLANTDIVVDYPLNKILKLSSLSSNPIFRFERVYDPFYSDADVTNTNGTRVGGMFYYKIKF
ncbi:MAG: translocation/assembly module TamB domain-containing protein [Ignavibacteria bacterium]|nr:translocation/assembly module TamB domain-containing protein [Ignavibacteria bacterium]